MIPRIMRKWRDSRDVDYGMAEALSLGYENLFFPIGTLTGGMVVAAIVGVVEKIVRNGSKKSADSTPRVVWSG